MNHIVKILLILVFFGYCQSPTTSTSEEGKAKTRSAFLDTNPSLDPFTSPEKILGVYISNKTTRNPKQFHTLRNQLKQAGFNTLVIDFQPVALNSTLIQEIRQEGFFPIARIVNFEGGLVTEKPPQDRMISIQKSINLACQAGIPEINLDYIRYADGGLEFKASHATRYNNITGIIREHKEKTKDFCDSKVKWSADIFGRVPFIDQDGIGQRVENFVEVVDALYPMLYPSHFYGLKDRVNDPYGTVKQGMELTLKRMPAGKRGIAWIQGFNMHVGGSGLTLKDYIKVQMKASFDSGSSGFVIWNAWNDYEVSIQALEAFRNGT